MNLHALVDQPHSTRVSYVTADEAEKPKLSNQLLSEITRKYAHADRRKACWQLLDTFIPYGVLWALMLYTVQQGYPYWFTLALAVIAAGLLVRIFILFHDCCHGSFFPSRRANTFLGYLSGILIFTPFENWRYAHAVHHATAGDLDRRGIGDVWTMTTTEYLAAPRSKRLAYRIYRNPFILFIPGPVLLFLVFHRFSAKGAKKRERVSVAFTNLAILLVVVAASLTIGLRTYLLIQFPVIAIAGALGLWLFYLQHQFENVYWSRHEFWDPMRVALEGSSYLKLPKILQWFTGNIGLHHIHHARQTIPNYHLQQCYDNVPAFHYLDVMELPYAWVAVLIGGNEYREYVIDYDPDDALALREAGAKFWESLQVGDEPPIDASFETYAAVRELHPDIDPDLDVPVDPALYGRYMATKADADSATAAHRQAKSELLTAMGNARRALVHETPVLRRQPGRNGSVSLYPVKESA